MSIVITLPGQAPIEIEHLALDFTGTLSVDGRLQAGVAERLMALSELLEITVITADTRGAALAELAGLPLGVRLVRHGHDKAGLAARLGCARLAAIGNGRNDIEMLEGAALAIAVMGAEGTAAALLSAADVVAPDITSALDLLLHPVRLVATLRD